MSEFDFSDESALIKKGKFIVIEGPDGIGKTSIINKLKDKLDNNRVVFLNDPYVGNIITDTIGKLVKNNYDKLDSETAMLLFIAGRIELNKIINNYLNRGINVICDRYIKSTFVLNTNNESSKDLIWITTKSASLRKSYIQPNLEIILLNHDNNIIKEPEDKLEEILNLNTINDSYNKLFKVYTRFESHEKLPIKYIIIDKSISNVDDTVDETIKLLSSVLHVDCFI